MMKLPYYRDKKIDLSRPTSMELIAMCRVLVISVLFFVGCQFDPYAHLCVTSKPRRADVIGTYKLTYQSVTSEGLAALNGKKCRVAVRRDGTFEATNVPSWTSNIDDSHYFENLSSGSGTWRIGTTGAVDGDSTWGIYFDSNKVGLAPGTLTGAAGKYGLLYTLGDPDYGTVLIFEKTP
jgi:hypothetical protein